MIYRVLFIYWSGENYITLKSWFYFFRRSGCLHWAYCRNGFEI